MAAITRDSVIDMMERAQRSIQFYQRCAFLEHAHANQAGEERAAAMLEAAERRYKFWKARLNEMDSPVHPNSSPIRCKLMGFYDGKLAIRLTKGAWRPEVREQQLGHIAMFKMAMELKRHYREQGHR